MTLTKHNELAMMAGICNIVAFSFLVYHVHITKITDNLTYIWICLVLISQSLLFFYGRINQIFGIYMPALIMFSGIIYILYVKLVYTETRDIENDLKQKNILQN